MAPRRSMLFCSFLTVVFRSCSRHRYNYPYRWAITPIDLAQPPAFHRDPPSAIIRRVTVMLVERNAEVRRVIRRIVADLADEIHECATPSDAYAAYRDCHPDVVVMDLGTPPCDGIWATRQILSLHAAGRDRPRHPVSGPDVPRDRRPGRRARLRVEREPPRPAPLAAGHRPL